MAPLRLAILEADVPLPGVDARYKGYHGVFKDLFSRAAAPEALDRIATLSRHDVVNDYETAYPPLDDVDGILITGSKHSAFEDDPWIVALVDYVRAALAHPRGVRVVGVCFGHQIVSRAMGVPVCRSAAGWEVSVIETRLTDAGRRVFGVQGRDALVCFVDSPLLPGLQKAFIKIGKQADRDGNQKIQQMHRDQAIGLPEGAMLLASTDICPNQGFLVPGRVITVQGHPEFTAEIMEEILEARQAIGLFPEGVYESGMARRGDDHDGVLMARVFLKFLQEPAGGTEK